MVVYTVGEASIFYRFQSFLDLLDFKGDLNFQHLRADLHS